MKGAHIRILTYDEVHWVHLNIQQLARLQWRSVVLTGMAIPVVAAASWVLLRLALVGLAHWSAPWEATQLESQGAWIVPLLSTALTWAGAARVARRAGVLPLQHGLAVGVVAAATCLLLWTIYHGAPGACWRDPHTAPWTSHRDRPTLAAFMMVAWDLSFDPIFSTINHAWIWLHGGSYFGVPFSNFLGWLLTTFVLFQVFALFLNGRLYVPSTNEQLSSTQSVQAILFYGLIAVGYVLNSLTKTTRGTVTDAAGMVWWVQDIYAVSGLMAIFTMGAFTILGLVKLM